MPTCECTEVQCTVQRVQPDRGHHCGRRRNKRYDSTGLLKVTVTDDVVGRCVEAGGVRGPGPPGGWMRGQLRRIDLTKMPQNIGDGLATTPSHVHAQSMYHCALCINYLNNNHNRNCALLYYLSQENKSFGSKKPFAFILWCTRSCVKHSYSIHHKKCAVPEKYGIFQIHGNT
jgi:hypothetical protein